MESTNGCATSGRRDVAALRRETDWAIVSHSIKPDGLPEQDTDFGSRVGGNAKISIIGVSFHLTIKQPLSKIKRRSDISSFYFYVGVVVARVREGVPCMVLLSAS